MQTPIRVRGKNNRDRPSRSKKPKVTTNQDAAEQVQTETPSQEPPYKKVKRTLPTSSASSSLGPSSADKDVGSPSSTSSSVKQLAKSRTKRSAPKKLVKVDHGGSALERLPLELLQEIFLMSRNLNLPDASPILFSRLSNERMYWRCCLFAMDLGIASDVPGAIKWLSQLLKKGWMTLARWQRMESAWDDKFETKHQRAERKLVPRESSLFPMTLGVSLPGHLLQSPFTDERDMFLTTLIEAGAYVDWMSTSDGEVASAGLSEAIKSGRRTTLRNLISRPVGVDLTLDLLKLAVIGAGCNRETVQIVADTLRTDAGKQIDWFDPQLRSWARARAQAGSEDGKWLLDLLRNEAYEETVRLRGLGDGQRILARADEDARFLSDPPLI